MKLTLRDRNEDLVEAWKREFKGLPDVEVSQGDIFEVPAQVLVSPSNSWGFLNGGIDALYTKRFGRQLQDRLQDYLCDHCDGELPVGQAVMVSVGMPNEPYEFLVSAPTMSVPMDVSGTVNAYLAFRAALRLVFKHNQICERGQEFRSMLCPGLGTGIGKVSPEVCAFQMREAWRVVAEGKIRTPKHLNEAWGYHEGLRRGLVR